MAYVVCMDKDTVHDQRALYFVIGIGSIAADAKLYFRWFLSFVR